MVSEKGKSSKQRGQGAIMFPIFLAAWRAGLPRNLASAMPLPICSVTFAALGSPLPIFSVKLFPDRTFGCIEICLARHNVWGKVTKGHVAGIAIPFSQCP